MRGARPGRALSGAATSRGSAGATLLVAILLSLACRGDGTPAPDKVAPPATASAGCTACHSLSEGTGGLHGSLGCETCHAGDATATTVHAAHRGMELEPGALDRVAETCGQAACHAREAERTKTSPMATARGLVAVDRWVFGELDQPDGEQTLGAVLAVETPSPGEDHVRRLCAGCHLGTRKANRDDAIHDTGSGCGACHVGPTPDGAQHPAIDATPPNERCTGCHSRSARISLSYQGLAEVSGPPETDCEDSSRLPDGRTVCRVESDLHHEAGLACVDCHLHTELMGDGTAWKHQEQAVEVRCETCHGLPGGDAPTGGETTWAAVDDPITATLLRLRGQTRPETEAVRVGRRGTPLWNLRPPAASTPDEASEAPPWRLHPKAGGEPRAVAQTPEDRTHRQPGHDRLTCSSCHSAWVPSCPDCHTRFDPKGEQWDFGVGALRPGAWVESSESMGWAKPVLAVSPEDRVIPAAPGMILRIEPGPDSPAVERRHFARSAPHTTRRVGHDCRSCHLSPEALGLGSGRLSVEDSGAELRLGFEPHHPVAGRPGLARDGWVQLAPPEPGLGTRVGLRSLNSSEQRRVLQVGACLGCHGAEADLFGDFAESLKARRAGRTPCSE